MQQIQCPNCGGYRVNSWKLWFDRKGGVAHARGGDDLFFFVLGTMIFGIPLFFLKLPWVVEPDDFQPARWVLLLGVILSGLCFVLLSYVLIARPYLDGYGFKCLLCNFQWSWKKGDVWPEVQVRPNLIKLGHERLEEERRREEEQRREEAHRREEQEELQRRGAFMDWWKSNQQ